MRKDTLSETINQLFAAERWAEARPLIEAELRKPGNENDHWLLTRLSTTYYEERQYQKALELVRQAEKIAPDCPLVLWDLAGTLDALDRPLEALKIYEKLIDDPDRIAEEECGEGRDWAVALSTDCLYRAAICLKHLGMSATAIQALAAYIRIRELGGGSIYSIQDALTELKKLVPTPPEERKLTRKFQEREAKLEAQIA